MPVDVAFLLQLLINGLVIGMIYALLAMGLALIFGVLEIVNFAHGEIYMVGAMLAVFLLGPLGLGYWPTILAVGLAAALLGLGLFEGLLKSLKGHDFERSILLTMGVSMVLQNGALYLFTATPRMVDTDYAVAAITLAGLRLPLARLMALGVGLFSFALLYLALYRTRLGQAMRGIAQSRDAALMVGIEPSRIARLAVMLGMALSGIAGAALAPVYTVQPTMGLAMVFKAFAIVILGGLGSLSGAAAAALLLGLAESLAGGYFTTVLQDALAFILMIGTLLLRPQGLFGRGVRV